MSEGEARRERRRRSKVHFAVPEPGSAGVASSNILQLSLADTAEGSSFAFWQTLGRSLSATPKASEPHAPGPPAATDPGQYFLIRVGSNFCRSGWVSHLGFGYRFVKFHLKTSNFSIACPSGPKKCKQVESKSTRVRLLCTKSMSGSGPTSSLRMTPGRRGKRKSTRQFNTLLTAQPSRRHGGRSEQHVQSNLASRRPEQSGRRVHPKIKKFI